MPTLEIDRVALPVFVRVTVCERDVMPTVSGEYVKVVVESETTGIPPAPLRGIDEKYPVTISVTNKLSFT